jgi:type I restriction enzyme S subunit
VTWEWTTLGEVAQWSSGGTPQAKNPKFYDGDIPWAIIGDLNDGVVSDTRASITEAGLENSSAKVVPAGTLLIAMYGSIGKLGIAGVDMATNQAIATARVGNRLDTKFLFFYLLSQRDALDKAGKGATQRNISQSILKPWPVPVPPLEEQRGIVAILEDHLSRLDAAERQLHRARARGGLALRAALYKGLRGQLVVDDLSEGDASEITSVDESFEVTKADRWWPVPLSWRWARIGDLFDVNVGATPSRSDIAAWRGDLAWVSSGEVAFNRITSTRESIARSAINNSGKRIQPPGTVLLAMIGEGKTRGQAAILDIEAAHNQNCASIRVSQTQILPEYIFGYLEERYLETRRGAAGGQQLALNKAAISRFPVPIAPLATQRALVATWRELRGQIQRLEESIEQMECRSAALRRSLLAAAFSGRLTGSRTEMSVV